MKGWTKDNSSPVPYVKPEDRKTILTDTFLEVLDVSRTWHVGNTVWRHQNTWGMSLCQRLFEGWKVRNSYVILGKLSYAVQPNTVTCRSYSYVISLSNVLDR